jgi:hypothetical protein
MGKKQQEAFVGYKRAVELLDELQRDVRGGPRAVKAKADKLKLPPSCGDLEPNWCDGFCGFRGPIKPTNEDILHHTVEQYLSYFYRLPLQGLAHTAETNKISLAWTCVPWLASIMAKDEEGAPTIDATTELFSKQVGEAQEVKPVNCAEMICTAILKSKTLDEFLKKDGDKRPLTEDEKFVFQCLRRASRKPASRSSEHWRIVTHLLKVELKLLTGIKDCLDLKKPRPLSKGDAKYLVSFLEHGETWAEYSLGGPKQRWHFVMDFEPRYIPKRIYEPYKKHPKMPRQLHVARVLAAKAAFYLCQAWYHFSQRLSLKDYEPYSFVRKCQSPGCDTLFLTGHDNATACPRTEKFGKSDCRKKVDEFLQRFLRKTFTNSPQYNEHMSYEEFESQYKDDPGMRQKFISEWERRHPKQTGHDEPLS